MDFRNRPSYHKRIFLFLLAFSWSIVICFVCFQYFREREFKSEYLNAQLQLINRHNLELMEKGSPAADSLTARTYPFEEIRITLLADDGKVIFDNMLDAGHMDNHLSRPEIIGAINDGSAYNIGRRSASDGRQYFYSATKGKNHILRSAIPYSADLSEMLRPDRVFLLIMLGFSVIMSIIGFFATRRLGKNIEDLNVLAEKAMKRQLTNNINHELKTPVASMNVCLETLLSGIELHESKRTELIERCYAHNIRLRRLLDDISLITRMEDGGRLIEKEEVSLNRLIQEIEEELQMMPEEERMNLHVDFTEEVNINGNTSLIGSIFRNLTENSIAYSEGHNIYISLIRNDGRTVRLRYEDDGQGIAPKHLPHLFERFYRVDKGRSRKKGGTGLGLAIVKHAVLFHGGDISVCNRPEGGLRFDFSLNIS